MTTFSSCPTAFIFHKRLSTEPLSDARESKKARYLYVLESESECTSSDDGTESIHSVQGKETDYVRDTTDTETKSDITDTDVEYEIASTTEDEQFYSDHTSSGNEFERQVQGVFAVSLQEDSIVDIVDWGTDGEDDSESNDVPDSIQLLNLQKCRICGTRDTMGSFIHCNYCYKEKNKYYPPRPRKYKHKKSSNNQLSQSSVSTIELESCSERSSNNNLSEPRSANQLSQTSTVDLENISELKVDKKMCEASLNNQLLQSSVSTIDLDICSDPKSNKLCEFSSNNQLSQTSTSTIDLESIESSDPRSNNRLCESSSISQLSQSSTSTIDLENSSLSQRSLLRLENLDSGFSSLEFQSPTDLKESISIATESNSESSSNKLCEYSWSDWALATKEMCIICNVKPKNGIFLHSSDAHLCCCYSCAVKFWIKSKKCAYCNRKVKNVVKAFVV